MLIYQSMYNQLEEKIGRQGMKELAIYLVHTNEKSHLQYYSKINNDQVLKIWESDYF